MNTRLYIAFLCFTAGSTCAVEKKVAVLPIYPPPDFISDGRKWEAFSPFGVPHSFHNMGTKTDRALMNRVFSPQPHIDTVMSQLGSQIDFGVLSTFASKEKLLYINRTMFDTDSYLLTDLRAQARVHTMDLYSFRLESADEERLWKFVDPKALRVLVLPFSGGHCKNLPSSLERLSIYNTRIDRRLWNQIAGMTTLKALWLWGCTLDEDVRSHFGIQLRISRPIKGVKGGSTVEAGTLGLEKLGIVQCDPSLETLFGFLNLPNLEEAWLTSAYFLTPLSAGVNASIAPKLSKLEKVRLYIASEAPGRYAERFLDLDAVVKARAVLPNFNLSLIEVDQ